MTSDTAIRVRGLTKSYGDLDVLRGVDLDVARGSIFALLGSNGAGKTTVVKILSTLLAADAGTASVNGRDVATQAAQVRESISLTGQFAAVDEILTGRENLVLVARLRHLEDPGAIVVKEDPHPTLPTIRFDTTPVQIEVCKYRGTYKIVGVADATESGNRSLVVTKGMASGPQADVGFILEIAPSNALRFGTTADGCVVVGADNPTAAEPHGSTLRLNTCAITIEPTDPTLAWRVRGVEATAAPGARQVVLLPGLSAGNLGYILLAAGESARFHVDAQGVPTPAELFTEPKTGLKHIFRLSRAKDCG